MKVMLNFNLQVCFEGDFEAALITFSSHAEASSAYKSTEAVLNNRFIKVFWHNSEKEVSKYVKIVLNKAIFMNNNQKVKQRNKPYAIPFSIL